MPFEYEIALQFVKEASRPTISTMYAFQSIWSVPSTIQMEITFVVCYVCCINSKQVTCRRKEKNIGNVCRFSGTERIQTQNSLVLTHLIVLSYLPKGII